MTVNDATAWYHNSKQCMSLQVPLSFKPPSQVKLIGAWAHRTALGTNDYVDVSVDMPKSCFREKDQLNHRYHAKRAMYLAAIAEGLKKSKMFKEHEWGVLDNDARCGLQASWTILRAVSWCWM